MGEWVEAGGMNCACVRLCVGACVRVFSLYLYEAVSR